MGARFTFTIPTVEEAGSGTAIGLPPLSHSAPPRRAVAGAGEHVRVLAVDDTTPRRSGTSATPS